MTRFRVSDWLPNVCLPNSRALRTARQKKVPTPGVNVCHSNLHSRMFQSIQAIGLGW